MNLMDRVRGILLRPRAEWAVIDTEQTATATLYKGYVMPLAAIGPVAAFIGLAVFGANLPLVGQVRISTGTALVQAIVSFVLALVGVYVLALIVNALAPSFGATQSMPQALKLAVYSSTASWISGIFAIIPALAPLGILGLYSLYLLYVGVPVLMKAPQQRAFTYTAAVIVVAIVVSIVIGLIGAAIGGAATI